MRLRILTFLMLILPLALPILLSACAPTDPAYEQRLDEIRARATYHGSQGGQNR